jgi:hypothetical protein
MLLRLTAVRLVEEGGPWQSYCANEVGWVDDPAQVALMEQRYREAGGLPPSVLRMWASSEEEEAAPGRTVVRSLLCERVISPWMKVASDGSMKPDDGQTAPPLLVPPPGFHFPE